VRDELETTRESASKSKMESEKARRELSEASDHCSSLTEDLRQTSVRLEEELQNVRVLETNIEDLEVEMEQQVHDLEHERAKAKEIQDALLWDGVYNQEQKERTESELSKAQSLLAEKEEEIRIRSECNSCASSYSQQSVSSRMIGTPMGSNNVTPIGTPLADQFERFVSGIDEVWWGSGSKGARSPSQGGTPTAIRDDASSGPSLSFS